jgi:hypothetical protein
VRATSAHRWHDGDARVGEHRVEQRREPAVPVTDQNLAREHDEAAHGLRYHAAVAWVVAPRIQMRRVDAGLMQDLPYWNR